MVISFLRAHKTIALCITFSGLFLLVSGILTLVNYGRLAPLIVLHFDAVRGVNVFGTPVSVWGIWFLGLTMNLVNAGLAYEFYHRERLLSYLYLGGSALISLLTLVAIGVVVTIN